MKGKLIAWVVSVAIAVTLPISARCAAPPMAEILPADSLGYIELPDMGVFYYVITEMAHAAAESLQEEEAVPENLKVKAAAMLEVLDETLPLLPKSASLGVVSVEPGSPPSLVLVSELSEALAPFASIAGKLLVLAPEVEAVKTEHGTEMAISPPFGDELRIGYAVVDNVLYVTMGEGLLDQVLSRATASTLSQTAHFKRINAITGNDAFVSAYVNVDAVCKTFLPALPPHAKGFAELLGLKDIHAVGFSLSANQNFVGSNFAIQFTEDAPGIASLLSLPNTQPKGLAYVPEDFSYVTRFSMGPMAEYAKKICALLDKAGAGEHVTHVFEGLKEGLGIDMDKVLASLGGELTVGVKIPQTLELPNIVLCLEATDPDYLMGTLKNLLTKAEVPFSEIEAEGKKIMTVTPTIPVPITPAIAAEEEMIVIAVSKAVLQKALAAKESGRNIAAKPSFKAAMEYLPADKNFGLEYIELEGLGRLGVAALDVGSRMAPQHVRPLLARAAKDMKEVVPELGEAVEVAYRTPGGLATQSRVRTRSVMQILRAGAAFAAKAAIHFVPRPRLEPEALEEPQEMEAITEPEEEAGAFIDLAPYTTSGLTNLHNTEGNNLPLTQGKYRLGGDPFQIGQGIVQLSGQNYQDVPQEARGIRVGLRLNRLHILHSTGWGSGVDNGTQIASYVVHYEDGSTVEIPVKYGLHVRDWWATSDEAVEVSQGKLAWSGRNTLAPLRLYSMTWDNPHPDRTVTAIDFTSAGTACAPFVVAMTGETE